MPGSRFAVLAPADMVLHAIVHLFYGGEMDDALRDLVDIADLLEHFGATEPGFWDGFWSRAEALDVTPPAWYALRYVQQLLGTQVPGHVGAAAEAAAPAGRDAGSHGSVRSAGVVPSAPGRALSGDRAGATCALRAFALGEDAAADAGSPPCAQGLGPASGP